MMGSRAWTADQSQRTGPYVERYPGYVVSYDGDCESFREREVNLETLNRNFIPLTPDDLGSRDLEDLWYMGIIVCPGEDVLPIAEQVADIAEGIGRDRISLYLAPGIDELSVVQRWKEAGLGPPSGVYPFDHETDPWRTLHSRFGNHHAEQVDLDQRDFPDRIQRYADDGDP